MASLDTAIEEAIDKNRSLVDHADEITDNDFNTLLGTVLQECDEDITVSEANSSLVETLEDVNVGPKYPYTVSVYMTYSDEALAEKLWGKLREDVDGELTEDIVPNRIDVPSLQVVYKIQEDGTTTIESLERAE